MNIISILAVLVFAIVLCFIEVPKMLKSKSYREFWSFSILLAFGVILTILKSLDVPLPNPSSFMALVFSPISDLMEPILK